MQKSGSIISGAALLIVVASVIAGLLVVDSPQAERAARRDAARVHDLHAIATELWQIMDSETRELPASLDEVQSSQRPELRVADPWTGEAYDFEVLSPKSYRLCATFETEGPHTLDWIGNRERIVIPNGERRLDMEITGSGYQCFEVSGN